MELINIILSATSALIGVLVLVVSYPLYKKKIKMNHWYGIRLRASFESDKNWYEINTYGAQRLMKWSLLYFPIALACLFLPFSSNPFLSIAITPLLIVPLGIALYEIFQYTKQL